MAKLKAGSTVDNKTIAVKTGTGLLEGTAEYANSVAWSNVTNKPNFADPSWKGICATTANVPGTGNTLGDTYVVLDDGDGKGALYKCKAVTGSFAQQFEKLGDVDWGLSVSTDGTLADNSDAIIVSQKAIKTYADGKIAIPASSARGDILVRDASGWTRLAKGAANAVLTMGADDPAWSATSGDPVGKVSFYAQNTAPTGFLKANGALVSRTTYSALFDAIGTTFGVGNGSTTFGLPDIRGEFIRGWADNRSVDTGRAFGSAQAEAFLSHSHNSYWYEYFYTSGSNGIPGNFPQGGSQGTYATSSTGGTETRPRNIALLACIKY